MTVTAAGGTVMTRSTGAARRTAPGMPRLARAALEIGPRLGRAGTLFGRLQAGVGIAIDMAKAIPPRTPT